MIRPLLIIISGPPGAGKTTLGNHISAELHLPFIHKDGIKETLFKVDEDAETISKKTHQY